MMKERVVVYKQYNEGKVLILIWLSKERFWSSNAVAPLFLPESCQCHLNTNPIDRRIKKRQKTFRTDGISQKEELQELPVGDSDLEGRRAKAFRPLYANVSFLGRHKMASSVWTCEPASQPRLVFRLRVVYLLL
jgi:hypothetical protein